MLRSRIRWKNVARAIAIAAAAIAAITVLPGLVEPPQPPPLPNDIGLESGATGAYAFVAPGDGGARPQRAGEREVEAGTTRRHATPRGPRADPTPGDRREPEPVPRPTAGGNGAEQPGVEPAAAVPPSPPTATPPEPVPQPAPAPVSAPAPASPPPEPKPPTPAPPDQAAHHQPPRGPSQFGFEQ